MINDDSARPTSAVSRRAALTGLGALGLALATRRLDASAQDATPTAAPSNAGGLTIEVLGTGLPDAGPGHSLMLVRITFAPDGFVGLHSHPGALVLAVESGELSYTVSEGAAQVMHPAVDGTPSPMEELTPGVEVTLQAGDSLFEQSVVHSARNAGTVPTVVLVSGLIETGHPFTEFMT